MTKVNLTIVATGSEITGGKSIDTNSGWIANEIAGEGLSVRNFIALPDVPETILEELAHIQSKANKSDDIFWIIMTGGLGPTEDDYTVDVVAKLINQETEVVEKARLRLESILRVRGKDYESLLPSVMRQTRVPMTSRVLENKVGIAPGFIVDLAKNCFLACLPGVPPEMKEMFHKRLLPILRKSFSEKERFRGEKFLWNIGESLYQDQFISKHPIIQRGNVEWGVTAKRGFIKVTFLSTNKAEIDTLLNDLEAKYPEQISNDVFTELHNKLIADGKQIAIAESCTGGWLAKLLTDQPGSSTYFIASLVTYHNQAKENLLFVSQETLETKGAVSEETAREMIAGLEKHFDIDYSLSITGIAGPEGGNDEKPVGLVYMGVKAKGRSARIIRYNFPGNRELVREATANNAIFQLYKELFL
ncbi:nicotinamide-nucleotide amidohydrolase family protein [Leptospira sp. GIMC2001]|uniref:nicotinamide-nucleotide amidohydrolase family protein n=1 Tax=Leptospira sp. GIMC2001 TaxID=1513297 RepID=UPI00234ABB22|nr:nicotinamide-nucleotide amidohydrolase family protein [Leptospira sp. GIMC2001]WCL48304.1 nicotinamide-nucleotide amidohydrolase family protein [Leptospira sp. GIMC2001]